MKKIKLITFHSILNYGAVLQAYALQKALNNLNFNVEIIDYRPFKLMKKYYKFWIRPKNLIGRIMLHVNFHRFRKLFLKLTNDKYYSISALNKANIQSDYFICGSDQIWSSKILKGIDTAYLFSFIKKGQGKKISYAPSMGSSIFPKYITITISELLNEFSNISVREKFAQGEVEKVIGKKPDLVIDPTLLLNDYSQVLLSPKHIPSKYILVYAFEKSSFLFQCIEKVKKKMELPVVNISPWHMKQADINKVGLSPQKWLGAIKNAEYVITNSYHGTIFSVLFCKKFSFLTLLKLGTNNRIIDFLKPLSLESRIIYPDKIENINDNVFTNINYEKALKVLKELREDAYYFLLKSIT